MIVGLISDTHGLLRPEAVAALVGSEVIVHAGDIGAPSVLDGLRAIAPVVAVRGNNDRDPWAAAIPERVITEMGDTRVCVIHEIDALGLDPARERIAVVVSGHSHKPHIEHHDGVLFVNPGSAGPRRFSLPIAVARLHLGEDAPRAELVTLSVAATPPARRKGRRAS